MKFEQKVATLAEGKTNSCVIDLKVMAEPEEVKEDYKKVLTRYLHGVEIPGYRRGKVPMSVVQQKFAPEIERDCTQACFYPLYRKAIQEAGLKVVALQNAYDVKFSVQDGFSFTVVVEVRPEFDLPKYKKLSLKAESTEVTDELISQRLESFRKSLVKFDDVKTDDSISVAEGDFVQIDYAGFLDIKARTPLSEVIPNEKVVAGVNGQWVQVEAGRFFPEIIEALKGMKVGETKNDIKIKFPKDNVPEAVSGKKCVYSVTLKGIRAQKLPDDAALLEAGECESMDALRAKIGEVLKHELENSDLASRRSQAVDLLLRKAEFDVPPSHLQRDTELILQDMLQRMQYSGMSPADIEKNRDGILEQARTEALGRVRLFFILLAIAEAEKVAVSEEELTATLADIAGREGGKLTADDVRKRLVENEQLEGLREQMLAEKTLKLVLDQAQVKAK